MALLGAASAADAAILKFTATSTSQGVLGFLTYDEAIFDGSSFQFVTNDNLLSIDFTDPVTSFHVTTPGPSGDSTIFDSSGAWPTVVGGSGFTGGTSFPDGVWIAGSEFVEVAGTSFDDVKWSTSVVGPSVPEPATWAMMLGGFGAVGGAMRSRRKAIVSFG
ncbi:MAG TPA: PEPxxWA-CTERM sorting domain-containing protein [Sphingomonas sp.]|nr:PEPxxWA-CTERM sorting domain-containing protein [Sphingomonas sp.]